MFSKLICAWSGFEGVEFVMGGVRGGIWTFMIRRSFSKGVWSAKGMNSSFVTIGDEMGK